jgi:hypothetical protein
MTGGVLCQALWDLNASKVEAELGEDIIKWQRMLVDITKARATFDTSQTSRQFGPVVIRIDQARVCPFLGRSLLRHRVLSASLVHLYAPRLASTHAPLQQLLLALDAWCSDAPC